LSDDYSKGLFYFSGGSAIAEVEYKPVSLKDLAGKMK
jgi:hypothetical protein